MEQKRDSREKKSSSEKELEGLRARLAETQKHSEEYREMLQRVQADFENYKKRAERESFEAREHANREFIARMLPSIDSFQLALKSVENREQFTEGVKMIYSQLYSTLEGMGLRQIECVGKSFDPYMHEVLLVSESGDDGIVLEELQKGYMVKGAVIRHSRVRIGKKADEGKKTDTQQKEKKISEA